MKLNSGLGASIEQGKFRWVSKKSVNGLKTTNSIYNKQNVDHDSQKKKTISALTVFNISKFSIWSRLKVKEYFATIHK